MIKNEENIRNLYHNNRKTEKMHKMSLTELSKECRDMDIVNLQQTGNY